MLNAMCFDHSIANVHVVSSLIAFHHQQPRAGSHQWHEYACEPVDASEIGRHFFRRDTLKPKPRVESFERIAAGQVNCSGFFLEQRTNNLAGNSFALSLGNHRDGREFAAAITMVLDLPDANNRAGFFRDNKPPPIQTHRVNPSFADDSIDGCLVGGDSGTNVYHIP